MEVKIKSLIVPTFTLLCMFLVHCSFKYFQRVIESSMKLTCMADSVTVYTQHNQSITISLVYEQQKAKIAEREKQTHEM